MRTEIQKAEKLSTSNSNALYSQLDVQIFFYNEKSPTQTL